MTLFIFAGDMLVMAFMVGLGVWVVNGGNNASIERAARIPLDDELPVEQSDLRQKGEPIDG